jgi:hypothetical protein
MDHKTMTLTQHIQVIADQIEFLADKYFAHPDDVARIHSVMMSIDAEIFERMKLKRYTGEKHQ